MIWIIIYFLFSTLFIIASILPLLSNQYWVFRICEFARIQILILQIPTLILGFFVYNEQPTYALITQSFLFVFIVYNAMLLAPYLPFKRLFGKRKKYKVSESISILSFNVYQYNKQYQQFISLVNEVKPDIFLTMESNADWELAMSVL